MNLFVYGTLLVPKIFEAVTGRNDLESAPGTLHGYSIRRVEGGDFPAIVEGSGSVPGKVIFEVPGPAMRRLDDYEDTFYRREIVEIATETAKVEAYAYVVPIEIAEQILSEETWTLDWFERVALKRYWRRLFQ